MDEHKADISLLLVVSLFISFSVYQLLCILDSLTVYLTDSPVSHPLSLFLDYYTSPSHSLPISVSISICLLGFLGTIPRVTTIHAGKEATYGVQIDTCQELEYGRSGQLRRAHREGSAR